MRCRSKACPSRRKIATLLSTEGFEWCIFLVGATRRMCETTKYEPAKSEGRLYIAIKSFGALYFNALYEGGIASTPLPPLPPVTVTTKVVLLSPFTPWRRMVGQEVWLHTFLTSALNKAEWQTSRPGRFRRKRPPVTNELEVGWVPEPAWTLCQRKSLVLARIRVTISRISSP